MSFYSRKIKNVLVDGRLEDMLTLILSEIKQRGLPTNIYIFKSKMKWNTKSLKVDISVVKTPSGLFIFNRLYRSVKKISITIFEPVLNDDSIDAIFSIKVEIPIIMSNNALKNKIITNIKKEPIFRNRKTDVINSIIDIALSSNHDGSKNEEVISFNKNTYNVFINENDISKILYPLIRAVIGTHVGIMINDFDTRTINPKL